MNPRISLVLVVFLVSIVSCKNLPLEKRDTSAQVAQELVNMAANNKQVAGAGLFSFGTLVSPLLFLMGMGSFMSMLPQMFQNVMRGVGPNLFQLLRPNLAATGGSSRLKRSADLKYLIQEDILDEIEKRLNLALENEY